MDIHMFINLSVCPQKCVQFVACQIHLSQAVGKTSLCPWGEGMPSAHPRYSDLMSLKTPEPVRSSTEGALWSSPTRTVGLCLLSFCYFLLLSFWGHIISCIQMESSCMFLILLSLWNNPLVTSNSYVLKPSLSGIIITFTGLVLT